MPENPLSVIELELLFASGRIPTGSDYSKLIQSVYNKVDDEAFRGPQGVPGASGASGASTVVSSTYSELVILKDSSSLVPGQRYLITDYRTTYTMPNTVLPFVSSVIEPLLVTAATVNTLYADVISALHPTDIIKYSIDNFKLKTDTFLDTNCIYGTIYFRYDMKKNVSFFEDFRYSKYRRWNSTATPTIYNKLTDVDSTNNYNDFYIFSLSGQPTLNVYDSGSTYNIHNISVGSTFTYCVDNSNIRGAIPLNTIFMGINCNNLKIGANFQNNTIDSDFKKNTIDNGFKNNVIGAAFQDNTIGLDFTGNTIGTEFIANVIGSYFGNNSIQTGFYNNTIGNDFGSNTIGQYFSNSNIGNGFDSNIVGNDFGHNTILDGIYNNTIGNDFKTNTIGQSFNNNSLGNTFQSNTIGNGFDTNTMQDGIYNNTIGNDFNNNSTGLAFNANTIGNSFQFNTVGIDFQFNTIGNNCHTNRLGNNFQNNIIIGNDFQNNTISMIDSGGWISTAFIFQHNIIIGNTFENKTLCQASNLTQSKIDKIGADFYTLTVVDSAIVATILV